MPTIQEKMQLIPTIISNITNIATHLQYRTFTYQDINQVIIVIGFFEIHANNADEQAALNQEFTHKIAKLHLLDHPFCLDAYIPSRAFEGRPNIFHQDKHTQLWRFQEEFIGDVFEFCASSPIQIQNIYLQLKNEFHHQTLRARDKILEEQEKLYMGTEFFLMAQCNQSDRVSQQQLVAMLADYLNLDIRFNKVIINRNLNINLNEFTDIQACLHLDEKSKKPPIPMLLKLATFRLESRKKYPLEFSGKPADRRLAELLFLFDEYDVTMNPQTEDYQFCFVLPDTHATSFVIPKDRLKDMRHFLQHIDNKTMLAIQQLSNSLSQHMEQEVKIRFCDIKAIDSTIKTTEVLALYPADNQVNLEAFNQSFLDFIEKNYRKIIEHFYAFDDDKYYEQSDLFFRGPNQEWCFFRYDLEKLIYLFSNSLRDNISVFSSLLKDKYGITIDFHRYASITPNMEREQAIEFLVPDYTDEEEQQILKSTIDSLCKKLSIALNRTVAHNKTGNSPSLTIDLNDPNDRAATEYFNAQLTIEYKTMDVTKRETINQDTINRKICQISEILNSPRPTVFTKISDNFYSLSSAYQHWQVIKIPVAMLEAACSFLMDEKVAIDLSRTEQVQKLMSIQAPANSPMEKFNKDRIGYTQKSNLTVESNYQVYINNINNGVSIVFRYQSMNQESDNAQYKNKKPTKRLRLA